MQQLNAENTVVLGVSFDTVAENRAFAEKFDFPYLLLCDTDREIGLAYHAASNPDQASANRITYLIGPDGTILRAYPKVTVETHAGEILEAVRAGPVRGGAGSGYGP